MAAVNNLVEKEELVAWSRMAEELRENTVTKLLHALEQSALALAWGSSSPTQLDIRAREMGERAAGLYLIPVHMWTVILYYDPN